MLLADATVLACLADHLSVGDLFRLRHALMPKTFDAAAMFLVPLVEARMRLKHKKSRTLRALTQCMNTSGRCRECGTPSRRIVRVCERCAAGTGPYALLTVGHVVVCIRRLACAGIGATGARLYWRADVLDEL